MNEKRFILCKKGDVEYIEDNNCIQLYSFDVISELLNTLNDENEQLRRKLYECEKDYLIETADISDQPFIEDEI